MEVTYQDIHKEIIELSKAGNSKAQYQLYKLYSKAMYNICLRMMNSKEDAEDVLQESFTEVFLKLETFRYESSFGAWIKRVVINRCINKINKRKLDMVLTENIPEVLEETNDDIDTKHLNVNNIQKAIQQLPEGYRVVFSLYLLEGYDHSEIARIMGITESTSKSQYSRAKQKIKELLKTQQL